MYRKVRPEIMRRPTAAVGSALLFVVAPGMVAGLIPWLLTGGQVREPLPYWMPMRVIGGVLLLAGVIVLVGAFVRFVVEGFGTPAPVAAPELLVVGGVYRYVRNPMYVAVVAAIVGQALLLDRLGLLLYAGAAWVVVAAPSHSLRPGSLKCACASIAPGTTWSPRVSTSSLPSPSNSREMAAISPSATARLASEGASAVTRVPPRTIRSYVLMG